MHSRIDTRCWAFRHQLPLPSKAILLQESGRCLVPKIPEKLSIPSNVEECDLIFDLELSNEDNCLTQSDTRIQTALDGALANLARSQERQFVRKLLEQVRWFESLLVESNYNRRLEKLGGKLCKLGYEVVIRSRCGGGEGRACMRNVPHTYLVVKENNGSSLKREIIVETAFRSHFSIPWASKAYKEILEKIPEVFVGEKRMLEEVGLIMAREMAEMFTKMNRVIPPWRRTESILSKWSVQGCKDKGIHDTVFCPKTPVIDPKCSNGLTCTELPRSCLIPAGVKNPILGFF